MKYKVGDKVRVREDLNIDEKYGFLYVMDEMLKKVVTIAYVYDDCYKVVEDDYMWTDGMLEGLVEGELTAEEAIRKVKAAGNNPDEFIDVLLKDGKWTGKVC